MIFRATTFAALAVAAAAFAAPAQAATNLLVNGGFEAADLAAGDYAYPAHGSTVDGWYYYGPAIVNGTGPGAWWPNGPQPVGFEGEQFAALQTTGTLYQTFAFVGGRLDLAWLDAGRPYSWGCCNGDQTYAVKLYNWDTAQFTDVGQYATASGQAFTGHTASAVLAAGSYALIFQGLTSDRDETAFIDAVSAVAVPEPATWGLMILGFGGAGAMLRSRRRAVAA